MPFKLQLLRPILSVPKYDRIAPIITSWGKILLSLMIDDRKWANTSLVSFQTNNSIPIGRIINNQTSILATDRNLIPSYFNATQDDISELCGLEAALIS